MKNYSAYLFDMDGTLVNSEDSKGEAIAATCKKFGNKADANIYKNVMGQSWAIVTKHFFESAKISPNAQEFKNEFNVIYKSLIIKNLAINLNAKELLIKLKSANKKMGVVSSAATWTVEHILKQLELTEFFDFTISGEDVSKHKPDPEPYLLALQKLGLPASEVLIFEDSNAGIVAAKEAMCDVVAFKHKINVNNDLSSALQTFSDFSEINISI